MLDRAGDGDRHVELRRDDLAGLADLQSSGAKPASHAARLAPTAAPIVSASASMLSKFLPSLMPRPPETTIFASVSSGRSLFDAPAPTNRGAVGLERAGRVARDRPAAERGGGRELRLARRHAHDRRRDLDGGDRVAGEDRPLETVRGDDGRDVGGHARVEQRGDARQEILAEVVAVATTTVAPSALATRARIGA